MEIGFASKLYQEVLVPTPNKNEILLEPVIYLAIRPNGNHGLIYEQGKSGIQKILNYSKVYRPIDVLRKVLSRQKIERIRNDKWLVCGIGKNEQDQYFCFAHSSAQHFQSLIAVPSFWTKAITKPQYSDKLWGQLSGGQKIDSSLEALANELPPISGASNSLELDFDQIQALLIKQKSIFKPISAAFLTQPEQKQKKHLPAKNEIGAVLFGFGNYARTITLPYLRPFIHLHKVHEIDSCLLIEAGDLPKSTNPHADLGDEKYPVWLIAGFHHTHANLAIDALKMGVIPVIEKPIATTMEDFNSFEATVSQLKKPFYQCFQKRYQIFNDFIFNDFQINKGEPIHFKATVFEIPLHKAHWYNWPVSGSRIISNACHWIDHFLFLNDYCDWTDFKVEILSKEELLLIIWLKNGAIGIISLSDVGSNRIGMREYVEFSSSRFRATVTDSMHYQSECNEKIIRKYSCDKLAYLRKMYREIGQQITSNSKGDELKSLKSTKLSLLLENEYKKKVPIHD
ncbi:hypothetical protein [Algoriphagus sp.]|uniref:hypothetical protein n=1 Tax=Algoriphagus sp. TaxID=1872435 RepID=UPI00391A9FA8